jgi:hypothetical protein
VIVAEFVIILKKGETDGFTLFVFYLEAVKLPRLSGQGVKGEFHHVTTLLLSELQSKQWLNRVSIFSGTYHF